MQNMGIEVLFKGINSLRLWTGLVGNNKNCTDFHGIFHNPWISSWDGNEYPK